MRLFVRTFLLLIVMVSLLDAKWRTTKEIRLQKDETFEMMVNREGSQRLLTFRWTLYHNDQLIVFKSFDEFVSQHVLALNHHNQSFRVRLLPRVPNNLKIPFLLIKFKRFDHETNEALFEMLLRDEDEIFVLRYLNEKEE